MVKFVASARYSADDFENTAQFVVVWKKGNYVLAEKHAFSTVQSLSADHYFNLDITTGFCEFYTISAIRKTI